MGRKNDGGQSGRMRRSLVPPRNQVARESSDVEACFFKKPAVALQNPWADPYGHFRHYNVLQRLEIRNLEMVPALLGQDWNHFHCKGFGKSYTRDSLLCLVMLRTVWISGNVVLCKVRYKSPGLASDGWWNK